MSRGFGKWQRLLLSRLRKEESFTLQEFLHADLSNRSAYSSCLRAAHSLADRGLCIIERTSRSELQPFYSYVSGKHPRDSEDPSLTSYSKEYYKLTKRLVRDPHSKEIVTAHIKEPMTSAGSADGFELKWPRHYIRRDGCTIVVRRGPLL